MICEIFEGVAKIDLIPLSFIFSEVDFVCFDIVPRRHSIVRYRVGKCLACSHSVDCI